MNSRTLIVILLILVTIILGIGAVLIGDRLSRGPVDPDDTSAYDTPTVTVTVTVTPSICVAPNTQFWYGCPGEPEEDCGNGEWIDGTTITVDNPDLPFVLAVNCFNSSGQAYTNAIINCEHDGQAFQTVNNWFARDIEITEEGNYRCRCVDRNDLTCIDTDNFELSSGGTPTPTPTATPTPTPTLTVTPTIPVTALVSDEADRIIIGLVLIVTAMVVVRLGYADILGDKLYNHLFYNIFKKDIKKGEISSRRKNQEIDL